MRRTPNGPLRRARVVAALAAATAVAALALPAAAGAHVTVVPKSAAAGSYTVLDVRVPNERDDKATTKVDLKLPPGFVTASFEPVPGWEVSVVRERLSTPIETENGPISEQVSRIVWSGGEIPPGAFQDFPISVQIPDRAGTQLTFKALQTYAGGEVVRWIGAPDGDTPAPQLAVTEATGEEGEGAGAGHSGGAAADDGEAAGGGSNLDPSKVAVDDATLDALRADDGASKGVAYAGLARRDRRPAAGRLGAVRRPAPEGRLGLMTTSCSSASCTSRPRCCSQRRCCAGGTSASGPSRRSSRTRGARGRRGPHARAAAPAGGAAGRRAADAWSPAASPDGGPPRTA